ncbi:hypothetical protein [Natronolimnobius sp. AArcel1]|nr:hypothetical protein [Natronolimnobius sp. AArcel1]
MIPLQVSLEVFTGVVLLGILGTVVMSAVIIAYTVYEFRRKEIW